MSEASMSSSTGYSCSARSYLREMGRRKALATSWARSTRGLNFRGTSRFTGIVALAHSTLLVVVSPSRQKAPFHDSDGAQIAVPALDGMLLDEAVAPEELNAVGPDLHGLAGGKKAREVGRVVKLQAVLGPA